MTNNEIRLDSWHDIDWLKVSAAVKSLRQRIYVASQRNDLKTVSRLQKLMLRSRANWLQSIRRVTQINKGRRTPGVDQEVVTTPEERLRLLYWLETIKINDWNPPPVQRVEIPKDKGKMRPLGIPTIRDRIIQAIVKNALEPFWEARFESTSYGFRPGRSTHDAIVDIHHTLNRGYKEWVLDADIKGAFDNIDHTALMKVIGNFPARFVINRWLKAGVMKGQDLSPTEMGTPQGGIISPLLANIALHGMEAAIGVKYVFRPSRPERPHITSEIKVVRYADDFVVLAKTKEDAYLAQEKLKGWLADRGLTMSSEKTSIVHVDEGFDFLGFNIRRYNHQTKPGQKVILTRPSKKSIEKVKDRIRDIFQRHRSGKTRRLLLELNPVTVGWANYYRIGVSSMTFKKLDDFLWHRSWRYAQRRHPNKGKRWLYQKYFKRIRNRAWTLYDAESGVNIQKFSNVPIRRHRKVKFMASPDDPNLDTYWLNRYQNPTVPTGQKWILWTKQKGRCPECGDWLDTGEELEVHHLRGRGTEALKYKQLLHHMCHDRLTQRNCLSRVNRKVFARFLGGEGLRSPDLPDSSGGSDTYPLYVRRGTTVMN